MPITQIISFQKKVAAGLKESAQDGLESKKACIV
jgi:hypothetical protein